MGNCFVGRTEDDQDSIVQREIPPAMERPALPIAEPPPPYQERVEVFHPSPNSSCLASELTEEDQVKIAKRIGLIQQLPVTSYQACKQKLTECPICMLDFDEGEPVRCLPCLHLYHQTCIDDWLMRAPTCPSCMASVESAMFSSFEEF